MTSFKRKIKIYIIFIFTLFISFNQTLFAQEESQSDATTRPLNWTAGLKFHNPAGITVKKYFGNKAVDLIIGRPNPYKNYEYYYRTNRRHIKNKGYAFDGFDHIGRPWSFQIHYLVHHDIGLLPRLRWYYGGGLESRISDYFCNYHYYEGSDIKYEKEEIRNFSMGANAVLGIEYTFRNFPFMIFCENTFYIEAFERPLYINGNLSTGMRYTF